MEHRPVPDWISILPVSAALLVSAALSAPSYSAEIPPPRSFVCAARVDCGAPALPSTQDLPTIRTPTVGARDLASAREKCMSVHTGAYLRLAGSLEGITARNVFRESRGCRVRGEAFPINR